MTFTSEVCDSADLAGMEKLISQLSSETATNVNELHNCEWAKWERLSRELFNAPANSEDMTFLFERLRSVEEFQHLSLNEFYNIAHDFNLTSIREPRTLIYSKEMQSSDEEETDHINNNSLERHSSLCEESNESADHIVNYDDDASEQVSVFSSDLFTDYAIVILVMGDAVLSFRNRSQVKSFPLPSLTTIVSTHLHKCYPEATQIRSVSPCWLLTMQSNNRERLRNVLNNIEQAQISAQIQFMRHSLHIKLFDCFSKDDNDGDDNNNNISVIESKLLECVKHLLPLHLSANQTLYSEGEEAVYLYFIKEGSVTVSRQVEKHVRHINSAVSPNTLKVQNEIVKSTERHNLLKKNKELIHKGKKKWQSCNDNEILECVEVARLTSGDVCGEIALTGCDIDFRPAIDVVWTNSYWRERLQNGSNRPEIATSLRSTDDRYHEQVSAETNTESTSKVMEDENTQTMRRYVMTAIATSPTLVYALSYSDCARFLPSVSLRRLCEYVKGYPSYDDLFTINSQQREWSTFRHSVSYNIEKVAREKARYEASRFPPMTF